MTDDSQAFQVKLADLDSISDRMHAFVGFLSDSLTGLEQRINAVQQTWNGVGADAQAAAFQKWLTGAAEVSEGIADMKQAALDAHTRYSTATATNLAMLGRG